MMQPVTFTENKQAYKTDDIGKEEYRGDDVGADEEEVNITGDKVIAPDVPMYYDLYFDEDYNNWANEYDKLNHAKDISKVQEASKPKISIDAKRIEKPIAKVRMQVTELANVIDSKAAYMGGDPDYANFGRVYDQAVSKQAARSVQMSGYEDRRIAGDSDYTNWQ